MSDSDFTTKDYGGIGLSYANWRKMAGMNKNPFPQQQTTGVKPPSVQSQFDSIGKEWEAAKAQFGAIPGMFGQGQQPVAPVSPAPVVPAPVTPAPVIDNSFDYTSGIETSGLDSIGQMMGELEAASDIASVFA